MTYVTSSALHERAYHARWQQLLSNFHCLLFPIKETFRTLFFLLQCIKIIIILPTQTTTSISALSTKEGPPCHAARRVLNTEMLFLSYECLFLWENVSKWSYSGFWPEAFSVSRLQPLFVAIGKGNTKSRLQASLCIPCVKMHSEKYLFQIQMHQNRWSLDNFPPCVHISITRLFHIHKSKGSYIMQMEIRRNGVSSQRTHHV